jgi:hypothetical protein
VTDEARDEGGRWTAGAEAPKKPSESVEPPAAEATIAAGGTGEPATEPKAEGEKMQETTNPTRREQFKEAKADSLSRQPKKVVAARRLPANPEKLLTVSTDRASELYEKRLIPRKPKDGESLAVLDRPQVGPFDWQIYEPGDLVQTRKGNWFVVQDAAQAFKVGTPPDSNALPQWKQVVVVRRATDQDHDAVSSQRAQKEETTRIQAELASLR